MDLNVNSDNHQLKRSTKNPAPGIRQNYELRTIEQKNEKLFQFYQQQEIIPPEEWEDFITALKIELPASFRIQTSLREKDNLINHIESKFISKIANIAQTEGTASGIDPPKKVPFVPYAYQTTMSRAAIRSHPILKEFHEFLINETELGYISRQELCSMIPPLLLDIHSDHLVLDACAAPGSKTMQILEMMHANTANPKGLLVANDVDYKRCYLLVHQTLKRMPTANCVVTSHDCTRLPVILSDKEPMLYDRILCDLICSGDGTFRKNPELWNTWDQMKGVHLHKLQLQIARRCVDLLKPGGLMCYSTCSLNPLEDEAVVAQILRAANGKIELVDISNKLTGLKRLNGIRYWKVFNKRLIQYNLYEDVPDDERHHFKPSMFPPTDSEAEQMHLERTFRILPHHQNTGGFFVALLRKVESSETQIQLVDEGATRNSVLLARKPPPPKQRRQQNIMNREDPFVFLTEHGEENELKRELSVHFGVSQDEFPFKNLLVRSNNTERKKEIYYVNDKLRKFLIENGDRFKIVNAGMGIFKKIASEKVAPCPYRLKQDGLKIFLPWIKKRIIDIPISVLVKILNGGTNSTQPKTVSQYLPLNELAAEYSELFTALEPGSVILRVSEPFPKEVCAWIGANSVSAFISREERFHLLSILGQDTSKFQRNVNTTRQEKAQRLMNKTNHKDGIEVETAGIVDE